ncbi:MAG: hypothetical protein JEZ02_03480 [Desulfatibacillum sp.]|nr:hypothetical protein [Desulfatibacillum sp.]
MKIEIPATRFIAVSLILGLLLIGFMPVMFNQSFVWDDELNICQNSRMLAPDLEGICGFWTAPYMNMYIPATYTAWSAVSLAGQALGLHDSGGPLNAWLFHIINLFLHLINGVLIFILLEKLVKNRFAACVGALFFALHPVQAEAVSYITELKTLLAFAFSFLSINLYYSNRLKTENGEKVLGSHVLALALFVLALLSKPVAVVVPFFLFVINLLIFNQDLRKNLQTTAPWFLIVIPFILLTKNVQPPYSFQFVPSFGQRILLYGDAVAHYFYKAVFPWPLGLDYGRTPEKVLGQWWAYAAWIVPALVAGSLLLSGKRARPYLAGVLIFIIGFGPVSGLVPFIFQTISTVADRYMYFPMFGLGLTAAFLLSRHSKNLTKGIAIGVLILLAMGVNAQVRTWGDNLRLYTQGVKVNPRSAISYNNLAANYVHNSFEGVIYYHRALTIKPDYLMAARNLCASVLFLRKEQPGVNLDLLIKPDKKAEADLFFRKAVEFAGAGDYARSCLWMGKSMVINMFNSKILNNYAVLSWKLNDFKTARPLLELAADLAPDDPDIAKNLLLTLPGQDSSDTKAEDFIFFNTP